MEKCILFMESKIINKNLNENKEISVEEQFEKSLNELKEGRAIEFTRKNFLN